MSFDGTCIQNAIYISGEIAVADRARGVGGARRGEARSRRVRLHRRRRGRRGDDPREPRGVRAPPHQAADAHGQHAARPLGGGARHAVAGAVPPGAGRRALDRASGGRAGRGARGGRAGSPLLPIDRRLLVDRGHRGGDGRRAALVPALLDQRPRDRRQPAPASRPERLLGGRRHARHADPRLAAPRPPPRLSPVHQGRGLRAVLQRPGLPGEAREAAGGGHAHGGRDDALDVPAPLSDLGRSRLAPRADRPADARQGRADGRGRAAGRCRRRRRDHRLEPRRPAGGRRGRGSRRARRRARRGRRRGDGADGRRHPPRRGRRQGDGARRGRGARRPAVRLRARGRRPGGRGGRAPAALGRHRHHDGARRDCRQCASSTARSSIRSRYSGSRSGS